MPHVIWILYRTKTRGARVQVLLKGISCSGWGQELPWQCKVSPLIFTKGTLLSQSLGSASWEASRMTRKQICRFCSFGVAHLHTRCRCVWQGHPRGPRRCAMWHNRGVQGWWQGQTVTSGQGPPHCLRSYLLGGEKLERSGLSLGAKFKCQHSEPFYNLFDDFPL